MTSGTTDEIAQEKGSEQESGLGLTYDQNTALWEPAEQRTQQQRLHQQPTHPIDDEQICLYHTTRVSHRLVSIPQASMVAKPQANTVFDPLHMLDLSPDAPGRPA